ncbi:type II toxin-antitoxin system RelE/ParE family toxin [Limnohabitans sp. 15K]|uniref:type II toxin-antitoxin system RelE/ParE family toxin n=1 Tax=Limnohabitans sp. 15K TaxID=1100706 RepID=UPI000C1E289A|nr:type II toxin-antitoxin system RelE/ParE family toxin [Limnohabitans sp. 15K]PIT80042.1 addiction module toxin RelE [Limnohabitans sp. 15K]
MSIQVFQTAAFARAYKKLHTNQQTDADEAVAAIVADPALGEPKKGDLSGVFVYKYRSQQQLMLLAYEYDPGTRMLLLLGSHENFYQKLKR